MLSHERYIGQLLDAGAHGYVLKSADKGEILVAIQTVAAGKQFLCSEVGLAMLAVAQHGADKPVLEVRDIVRLAQSVLLG